MIIGWLSIPDFEAVRALASLNPGDPIVYYFLYLLGFHLIVWAIRYRWLQKSRAASVLFSEMHVFTHQLGFALHGLYRVLAGATPAAIIILLIENGLASGWEAATLMSVIFAIGCITVSIVLSLAVGFTAPKESRIRDGALDF